MFSLLFALAGSKRRHQISHRRHFIPISDQVNGNEKFYGYVSTDISNLYNKPDKKSYIKSYAPRGKLVQIFNYSDNWYGLRLEADEGYMVKENITFIRTKSQLDKLLYEARSRIMLRYVRGEAGPGKFDGPGFIQWIFSRVGIKAPRTVSDQMKFGRAIDLNDLRAGDVFFFNVNGKPDHVAIISDAQTLIHCYEAEGRVVESVFNDVWLNRFAGVRRYLN